MVREDLVASAVSFLQEPSVSSAPLEQRIAFLRSKYLTQEEIDASLARVGQPSPNSPPLPNLAYRPPPSQYQQAHYSQGYPPQWQAPPEQPRRDWRDYFIAATVIGGVGYGMYWTARRYIYPLIAPPTPAQLESDKKSLDESFDKAFALLDQLATDTNALKEAEAERKSRLDVALGEVESVITRMKQANEDREMESKRIARELAEVRDSIPRALEKERERQDARLKDLAVEMKSLKTLVGNRMQGGGGVPPSPRAVPSHAAQQPTTNGHVFGSGGTVNGNGTSATPTVSAPEQASRAETNGTMTNGTSTASASPYSTGSSSERSQSSYSKLLGNKAAIPAWQLAAKKKAEQAKEESGSSTPVKAFESGTVADAVDGQS